MIILNVSEKGLYVRPFSPIEVPCSKLQGKMGTAPKGWDFKFLPDNHPIKNDGL